MFELLQSENTLPKLCAEVQQGWCLPQGVSIGRQSEDCLLTRMGVNDFLLAARFAVPATSLQSLSKTFLCCASSTACCVILGIVGGTAVATAFGYQGKA